jgi:myo-inositol catabolism protein IolH
MNFAKKTTKAGGESIACVSYFGFPEKMDKQAPEARERIERELL